MIKLEQNTGTLSQNLRHSIYFRQWNQMEQWHCFNVRKIIGISSMGLTSEMETVKLTVLLRTVCFYGPLVYINKEEYRAYITKGMGTGLRTIVKNCKVMFCWSNFFSLPRVFKFSNKLILLEFQMMVAVKIIS